MEKQPREQAVVIEGYPGAVLDAPDFYVGEVLDELFSGMASRLFERVRDQKGLAYFVRSGRLTCRSTAMFYFIAGTQPGKEQEVLEEIAIEIARVQAGDVSPDEIRRCQVRLKAGQRKALQTNSARAMQAAIDVLQGRGANHWKRLRLAHRRRDDRGPGGLRAEAPRRRGAAPSSSSGPRSRAPPRRRST